MAAQYSAHLSSNTDRPSIFELLSHDQLAGNLRSALKFLAGRGARSWPGRLSLIEKYSDEIILLLETFLNYYHLKKYRGSFAEYFYGLARTEKTNKLRCILLLAFLPYLRRKLEQLFIQLRIDEEDHITSEYEVIRSFYVRYYPSFHTITEGSYLISLLLYALKRSDYHSTSVFLSGSMLEYFNKDKHLEEQYPDLGVTPWYKAPFKILNNGAATVADYTATVLATGSYFIIFLEWWYEKNEASPFTKGSVIPPSPSQLSSLLEMSGGRQLRKGECPICLKPITNETVLSTSGISFCYACIFGHLIGNNACPVTGYLSTTDSLIKVHQ